MSPRDALRWIARGLVILTCAAAPWMFGSHPARAQAAIAIGFASAAWLTAVSELFPVRAGAAQLRLPLCLVWGGLFATLVGLQLFLPASHGPPDTDWSRTVRTAEVQEEAPVGTRLVSIAPAMTRRSLAKVVLALAAAAMGASLFVRPSARFALFTALGITGGALSIFGMAQKVSWDGRLFWSTPLRFGGQPFASFVNRNNAAGFLIICLAACLGGVLLSLAAREREHRRSGLVLFVVLTILNAAGLIAAESRGGLVAAAAGGMLVLPWCWRRPNVRAGIGVAGVLAAGFALTAWLGLDAGAYRRLASLDDLPSALGSRPAHWRSMMASVAERPCLGSGLGGYRYVNRPYQQEDSAGWYWNADNQYVEIAVETGLIGLSLIVAALVAAGIALIAMRRGAVAHGSLDLFASAAFVLIALGLQSATDFGVTHLALLAPAAILVTLAASQATAPAAPNDSGSVRRRESLGVLFAAALASGLAAFELWTTAPAATFCETLPLDLSHSNVLTAADVDGRIELGRSLASALPDDAELQYAVAKLLMHRYRLATAAAAKAANPGVDADELWRRTRLENLHAEACLATPQTLGTMRAAPLVRANLVEAVRLLQAASHRCDWIPGLNYDLATLSFLVGNDPGGASQLVREAELAAAEPERLMAIALLAYQAHRDALAAACCRRVLELDSTSLPEVVRVARTALDDRSIAKQLLVQPDWLIRFSSHTADPDARRYIFQVLTDAAEHHSDPTSARAVWYRGQAAWIMGHADAAAEDFARAVELDPSQVEWKLAFADVLLTLRRFHEAEKQLRDVERLDPGRPDMMHRLHQAVRGRLSQPTRVLEDTE